MALSLFFELRGHFSFGWRWYKRALAAHPDKTALRARTLWAAAHVSFYGGTANGLISLSVAAGATTNIRLMSTITLVPLYPPALLAKMGAALDVAVDIRVGSPTFGHHVAIPLSAEDGRQLLIPIGFAHGFCTLRPDTLFAYKVTGHYAPDHDKGVLWNDPALAIDWPVTAAAAVVSERDAAQPTLAELPAYFTYERDA